MLARGMDSADVAAWRGQGPLRWRRSSSLRNARSCKANSEAAAGSSALLEVTIIQTAMLNGENPEAYLSDTLARIADGHPISQIYELMPWADHD